MIVTPQEYSVLLERLKDPNTYLQMIRIPEDEPVYEIDLNTRLINAPEFLSVEEDHNSEIVWFKVRRFFDNIDLYDSTCWIQYKNAQFKEYFYAAPLIVELDEFGSEWVLIPWAISKEVAALPGSVEFSFQFFKLSEDKTYFNYVLNTQVASSKILHGLRIDPIKFIADPTIAEEDCIPERAWLADELHRLTSAYEKLAGDYELYWIEA